MLLFIEHTLNTYCVPDPEEACRSPPDTKPRSTAKGGHALELENSGVYPSKKRGAEEMASVGKQGFLASEKNYFTYERCHPETTLRHTF